MDALELTTIVGSGAEPFPGVDGLTSTQLQESPSGVWKAFAASDGAFWRSADDLSWERIPHDDVGFSSFLITDDGDLVTVAGRTSGTTNVKAMFTSLRYADGEWFGPTNVGSGSTWNDGSATLLSNGTKIALFTSRGRVHVSDNSGVTWSDGGSVGVSPSSSQGVRPKQAYVVGDVVHVIGYRPYFGWRTGPDAHDYSRWSFASEAALSFPPTAEGEPGRLTTTELGDPSDASRFHGFFADPDDPHVTWRLIGGYGFGFNLSRSEDDGDTWSHAVLNEPVPIRGALEFAQPRMLSSREIALFSWSTEDGSTTLREVRWSLEDNSWTVPTVATVATATGTVALMPTQAPNGDADASPQVWFVEPNGRISAVAASAFVSDPVAPNYSNGIGAAVLSGLPAQGPLTRHVSPGRTWQLVVKGSAAWRTSDGTQWEQFAAPTGANAFGPVAILDDGTVVTLISKHYSPWPGYTVTYAYYFGDAGWAGAQRIAAGGGPASIFSDGSTVAAISSNRVFSALDLDEASPGAGWASGMKVADGENALENTESNGSLASGANTVDVVGDVAHIFGTSGGYSRWSFSKKQLEAFEWSIVTEDTPAGPVRTVDAITIASAGGAESRAVSVDGSADNLTFFTPVESLVVFPSADGGRTLDPDAAFAEAYPVPITVEQVATSTSSVRFLATAECSNVRLVYGVSHALDTEMGLEVVPVYLDETGTAELLRSTAGGATASDQNEVHFTVIAADGTRSLIQVDSTLLSPEAVFGYDGYGITTNGVNTSIGNFVESDTDAAIAAAGVPLQVTRTYNSADGRVGFFGRGWTSNYEARIFENCITGDATILHGDGRREQHRSDGNGGYLAAPGYTNRLVKTGTTGWTLNETDGTQHTFRNDGRLVSMVTADGHQTLVNWLGTGNGAQLADVVDVVTGRQLTFTYDGQFISSVSTSAVTINGEAKPLTWNYVQANGSLAAVCEPRDNDIVTGNCTRYTNEDGIITTIIDPNGNIDRQIGYVAGKVAWEETGTGDRTTFEYVDATTTIVTDPNGHATSTVVDERRRTVLVIDPLGNETAYAYDDDGFRSLVTDANSNTTMSTFDERGNALSTTNGAGETTYFEYDEHNNLTVTRDARSSGPADNTYLAASQWSGITRRQLSETLPPTAQHPSGITMTWTYANGSEPAIDGGLVPAGLLLVETDGNGASSTMAYDSAGNLRSMTDRSGLVVEYGYDELGRRVIETQISATYPSGVATITSYDELGNELVVTGPATTNAVTGEAHQLRLANEYDATGNLIRRVERDIGGAANAPADRIATYAYDAADRPVSATDPEGGVASREYDPAGNVVASTDEAGRRFEFVFDERNLQTSITGVGLVADEGGSARDVSLGATVYDGAGRLVRSIDPNGRVTSFVFDGANRQTAAVRVGHEDGDGSTRDVALVETSYVDGFPVRVDTGGGLRTETRTFDASGRLVETVLDPGGLDRIAATEFDANGNVVRSSLSDGTRTEETRYVYDQSDRLIEQTEENGDADITMTYQYDQRGVLISEVDARGFEPGATPGDFTFEYTSDELGRIVTSVAPTVDISVTGSAITAGRPQASTGLDAFGQVTGLVDERGNRTIRSYDRLGRLVRVDHPSVTGPVTGSETAPFEQFSYDPVGNLLSRTDRRGNTTSFAFDGLNRLRSQTDPAVGPDAAGVWMWYYDDVGNVIAEIDPRGARTEVVYDSFDRARSVTSVVRNDTDTPDRFTTSYELDDLGNVLSQISPAGDVVRATYSPVSETLTVTDAEGNLTTFDHDVATRQVAAIDPLGRRLETEYDLAGRPVGSTSFAPDGAELIRSTATFDAAGNVIAATQPRGHASGASPADFTQTFVYDAIGRLVATDQPVSSTERIAAEYRYDQSGNLTGLVDGRGNLTRYTYNAWNLQTATEEPAVAAESAELRTWLTEFDAGGLPVVTVEPGDITITRTFDQLGRLIDETGTAADAPAATRTFGYDAAGFMTSADTPGGLISFEYDDRGLLLSSAGSAPYASEFQYDAVGRMVARTDASGTSTFTYTERDQLESITDSLSGTTRTHGFDEAGQLVSVGFENGAATSARSLAYDDLGRLTSDVLVDDAGSTSASYSYGYDVDGNVTSKLVDLPGNSASGEHVFDYDNAGRITGWTDPGGNSSPYGWDASGNLVTNGGTPQTFDSRNRLTQTGNSAYDWTARGTLNTVTTTTGEMGTIVVTDDFDQADGSAPSSTWTTTALNGATALADAGQLSMDLPEGTGVTAAIDNVATALRDSETTLTFSFASATTADRARLRVYERFGTDRVWVDLYSHTGAGRLYERVDGVTNLLATFSAAVTTEEQKLKITLDGDAVAVTTWLVGDDEPVTPTAEATTAALAAGRLRIQTWRLAGSNTVMLDDVELRSAELASGESLLADDFADDGSTRPDGTLWREFVRGDASASTAAGTYASTWTNTGGSYTFLQSHETLPADADLQVDYQFASTASAERSMFRVSARYSAGDRVWVDIRSNSTTGRVYQRANGATTLLGTFLTQPSIAPTTLRVSMTGDVLSLRTWNVGEVEPTEWDASFDVSDVPSGGRVRLESRRLAGVNTMQLDNVIVVPGESQREIVEGYIFDALGRASTTPSASFTYDSFDRIATADSSVFAYAGLEIDPVGIDDTLIARSPGSIPIASQTGAAVPVLLGRNAHGDVGYLHDAAGAVSSTSVFDPFGGIVGDTSTGSVLGFQGDYTDQATGDVWMGARWYRPGTGGFVSRDTVFGQLQTPMSVNRYTYGLGDPLGRWDPDGRCSKKMSITYMAGSGMENACSDDGMDLVSSLEQQRSLDMSTAFMSSMLDGLRSVAENPLVSLVVPGADCAVLALDRAQGADSETMAKAGCGMDMLPVVGKALKVFKVGADVVQGGRRTVNAANRAGDVSRRVDDIPALSRVEAPSVSRVAPEPPTVRAPEAKTFDGAGSDGPRAIGPAGNPEANPLKEAWEPNIGGKVSSFVTETDQVFWRVSSQSQNRAGAFLSSVKPRSSAFAREASALPTWNRAELIQPVMVPAGTRLNRSRALEAFGRRGGAEQFELLENLSVFDFGPRVPLQP